MLDIKKVIYTLLLLLVFQSFCEGQNQLSYTSKNLKLTKTQGSDQYQEVGCSYKDKSGNLWMGTEGVVENLMRMVDFGL